MGIGILARIPTSILVAALETCAEADRVAFRSSEWDVFNKANVRYGGRLPILICATQDSGDPLKLCDPVYATFRGFYIGMTITLTEKHPNSAIPPSATIQGKSPDMV